MDSSPSGCCHRCCHCHQRPGHPAPCQPVTTSSVFGVCGCRTAALTAGCSDGGAVACWSPKQVKTGPSPASGSRGRGVGRRVGTWVLWVQKAINREGKTTCDNRGAGNQREAERSSKKLSEQMREEKAVKLFNILCQAWKKNQ